MAAVAQLLALVHLVGWGTLSGAVSSALIIPLLNRLTNGAAPVKTIVALVWSVLVGLGTVYFAGRWNTADVATSLIAVIVAAQATYHTLVKPSGLAARLEGRPPAAPPAGPDTTGQR